MKFENIILKKDEGIARISLNRPQALNALTVDLLTELRQALDEVKNDEAVGVVVLSGEGRSFSAGVDLKDLEKQASAGVDIAARINGVAREVIKAMEDLPKPIIAAVTGHCLTGGLEIALACDMILASADSKFGDTHVRWGLRPTWGLSQKLSRLVGLLKAKELSFTAEMISAEEAARIGLINRVLAPEEFEADVQRLAESVLRNSRQAIAAYKALINQGYRRDLSAGLNLEFGTPLDVQDAGERTVTFKK